jgi:hypothetical protein
MQIRTISGVHSVGLDNTCRGGLFPVTSTFGFGLTFEADVACTRDLLHKELNTVVPRYTSALE